MEKAEKIWEPTSEVLDVINLRTEQDKKELKIGTLITVEEREGLISLLQEYMDIFA
jgi:hypothetical protein